MCGRVSRAEDRRELRDLLEVLAGAYAPEDRSPPWLWAHHNVRLKGSPYGDRFLPDETPWLKAPLETLADITIREAVVKACAQGGKSVMMQVACGWALATMPDPTMYVVQTEKAAKQMAQQRLIPLLESIAALAASMPQGKERHKKKLLEILFANAVLMIGPANESFLRAHSIRWGFGDECSDWAPGKMEQLRARLTRFWNRKAFFGSTPLRAGDDFSEAYKAGTQEEYHLAMPCSPDHLVYLSSENFEKVFQWREDNETRPEGVWDWSKVAPTVEMVCPHCQARFKQTESNMDGYYRQMIAGARYIVKNPKAPRFLRSFAFNVFCLPPSLGTWSDLVIGWLKAKVEETKGNLSALREFVTLKLAEEFDERKFVSVTMPDIAEYVPDPKLEKAWPEEKFRFMTVDCQKDLAEFWVVVRAWSQDGKSRLLAFEKVRSEAELVEIQQRWHVQRHLVGMDCGYEMYRVFEICVRNGWTALRGEHKIDYTHTAPGGKRIKRPYHQTSGDPRSGKSYAGRTRCPLFYWSNPSIKDLTWNLKNGTGAEWLVPDLGKEVFFGETEPKKIVYAQGLDSERKLFDVDKYGNMSLIWKAVRANHPWDCENMQVVFATIARCFGS